MLLMRLLTLDQGRTNERHGAPQAPRSVGGETHLSQHFEAAEELFAGLASSADMIQQGIPLATQLHDLDTDAQAVAPHRARWTRSVRSRVNQHSEAQHSTAVRQRAVLGSPRVKATGHARDDAPARTDVARKRIIQRERPSGACFSFSSVFWFVYTRTTALVRVGSRVRRL
eukprot:6042532-Pleurochrysis_carterae.AAC.1